MRSTTTDRGASTMIGYVTLLGVTVLLMGGLAIAAGGLIEDQQEVSVEGELRVVGDRVAADLLTADRLVQGPGDPETVRVTTSVPSVVSDVRYEITIEPSGDGATVVLQTTDGRTTVERSVETETPVEDEGPIRGATIEISYEGDRLVVRDA